MKFLILMICFCAASLRAQFSGEMHMDCGGANVAAVDDRLQQLAGPVDPTDKSDIECRFSYMESLSRSRDARALPLIVRYLDIENPHYGKSARPESKIFRPMPFGGQYPAIVYSTEYGVDAVPVLIQTISSEPNLSLKAKNAVRALMTIEARNPPSGVKVIAQAARNADPSRSGVILHAANFATTTWECHLILSECQNALVLQESEQRPTGSK